MIFKIRKDYPVFIGYIGVISLFILTLLSCAIQPVVESFRDPDLDYAPYKTFSFISSSSDKEDKHGEWSLEEKVLFPIVMADMERRGLTYQENKKESDFAVSVVLMDRYKSEYIPQKTIYSTSDTYLFHGKEDSDERFFIFPTRQPITIGGYTEDYFQIYAELNFYDSKTNKKIWKGSGLYHAETYDINIAAPPLISSILNRFRPLPKENK
jgi:hypothetical protein